MLIRKRIEIKIVKRPLCEALASHGIEFEKWPKDDQRPFCGPKKIIYVSPYDGQKVFMHVHYSPKEDGTVEARFEAHDLDFDMHVLQQDGRDWGYRDWSWMKWADD